MISKSLKLVVFLYIVITLPFSYFTLIAVNSITGQARNFKVGMVLGAGIKCTNQSENVATCRPSIVLKNRLDKALELYQQGFINKILVTGYGKEPFYNETTTMQNYLEANGVNSIDILVDDEGNSTIESCQNAKNVFKLNEVLLITQAFHISRSVYLCKSANIEVVAATIAENGSPASVNYGVAREVLASWKALSMTFEFKNGRS